MSQQALPVAPNYLFWQREERDASSRPSLRRELQRKTGGLVFAVRCLCLRRSLGSLSLIKCTRRVTSAWSLAEGGFMLFRGQQWPGFTIQSCPSSALDLRCMHAECVFCAWSSFCPLVSRLRGGGDDDDRVRDMCLYSCKTHANCDAVAGAHKVRTRYVTA